MSSPQRFTDNKLSWDADTMFELGFITSEAEWHEFSKLLNATVQNWVLDKLGVVVE